jgi:hypothetical protein
MMKWTAYRLSPIDFGWERLPGVKEVAAQLAADDNDELSPARPLTALAEFLRDFHSALQLAGAQGWEGDFLGKPRVFLAPRRGRFSLCLRLEAGQQRRDFRRFTEAVAVAGGA